MNPAENAEHLELEALFALAEGTAEELERQRWELHLAACADCAVALGEVRASSALEARLATAGLRRDRAEEAPPGFRVLGELGRGAMGVVLEAEQEEPRRRVALKLLRAARFVDAQALALFRREVGALARLAHPGIATLYGAGRTARGEPWLAMELVRGQPLTGHAGSKRLDRRARVELLARVADAVHHAHQRGVIHRDLKPSNVLVGAEGGPKVLDFGVAKLVEDDDSSAAQRTQAGELRGTVAYASPEQAAGRSGEVGAASDVYSLGVLLYELVCGRLPHDIAGKSLFESARAVAEEPPRRPRAVRPDLERDLEWVLLRTLEHEPGRRYSSAAELSADLRRFLAGEPVLAHPPGRAYELRKLVLRHRAISALLAALMVLLVGTAVTTTLLYRRADRQRIRALAEAENAAAVRRIVVALFEDSIDPFRPELSTAELLDEAVLRAREEQAMEPAVRAELYDALGRCYRASGMQARALELFEEAHALAADAFEPDSWPPRWIAMELGRSLMQNGRLPQARALLEGVLAACAGDDPRAIDLRATVRTHLVLLAQREGDVEEALRLLEEAQADLAALPAFDPSHGAAVEANRARVLYTLGRHQEAEQHARLATAAFEELRGKEREAVEALSTVGACRLALGDFEGAVAVLSELEEQLGGADAMPSHSSREIGACLALALDGLGRRAQAEAVYRRVLARAEALHGAESAQVADARAALAANLLAQRRHGEAEEEALAALELRRSVLGDDHPSVGLALELVAEVAVGRGEREAAALLLEEASELLSTRLAEDHPAVVRVRERLAVIGS